MISLIFIIQLNFTQYYNLINSQKVLKIHIFIV